MAVLKPDGLSRKTFRSILEENGIQDDELDDLKIADEEYNFIVMESDYHEGYQISADEGDLVFFDMVTYGYGDTIEWSKLEKQKNDIEQWAKDTSQKHNCSYKIVITANYW